MRDVSFELKWETLHELSGLRIVLTQTWLRFVLNLDEDTGNEGRFSGKKTDRFLEKMVGKFLFF